MEERGQERQPVVDLCSTMDLWKIVELFDVGLSNGGWKSVEEVREVLRLRERMIRMARSLEAISRNMSNVEERKGE